MFPKPVRIALWRSQGSPVCHARVFISVLLLSILPTAPLPEYYPAFPICGLFLYCILLIQKFLMLLPALSILSTFNASFLITSIMLAAIPAVLPNRVLSVVYSQNYCALTIIFLKCYRFTTHLKIGKSEKEINLPYHQKLERFVYLFEKLNERERTQSEKGSSPIHWFIPMSSAGRKQGAWAVIHSPPPGT